MRLWLPLVLLGLAPALSLAADTDKADPVADMSPVPTQQASAGDQERWSDFLPIFGREARQRGYVLPRPFGIGLNYMEQKQPFDVDGVEVESIDVKGSGLVVVDAIDNREDTVILRFDAWIFPFLNLYGIIGKTDGEATGPLRIDPRVALGDACRLPQIDCRPIDTGINLEYEGNVGGGGVTVAGGYKAFFAMIDSNYTVTNLDISSTDATAWVTSTRLGWNGSTSHFTGAFWIGAMYQDISQVLDLEVPLPQDASTIIDQSLLQVSVDQSTQVPWNGLFGGRWEIGKGVEMLAEFGFGQRRSNMFNLTYRF